MFGKKNTTTVQLEALTHEIASLKADLAELREDLAVERRLRRNGIMDLYVEIEEETSFLRRVIRRLHG